MRYVSSWLCDKVTYVHFRFQRRYMMVRSCRKCTECASLTTPLGEPLPSHMCFSCHRCAHQTHVHCVVVIFTCVLLSGSRTEAPWGSCREVGPRRSSGQTMGFWCNWPTRRTAGLPYRPGSARTAARPPSSPHSTARTAARTCVACASESKSCSLFVSPNSDVLAHAFITQAARIHNMRPCSLEYLV